MATNTNKRIPVKWIRDKAKAAYTKDTKCFICGMQDDLELHHLNSITQLFTDWCRDNGYDIETDEQICAIREDFIKLHHKELYDEVYTLCATHHKRLHAVYGAKPPLATVSKQAKWIATQKDKHNGVESSETVVAGQRTSFPRSGREGKSGSVLNQFWPRK